MSTKYNSLTIDGELMHHTAVFSNNDILISIDRMIEMLKVRKDSILTQEMIELENRRNSIIPEPGYKTVREERESDISGNFTKKKD